ncbi:hypothetical protein ACIBH1_48510 [Nonomuraea sp. NPDC050663]|uniref:hypothetical protein n=1 Tax=Nonomuraea sp. NPDC050663 TaxID=3364370 RepID=UPI0037AD53DD
MRTLLALLAPAVAAVLLAAQPASAVPSVKWGPYQTPGGKAKVHGTYIAVGEDHDVLPTADTLTVKGKLTDYARSPGTCAWVMWQFAIRKGNQFVIKEKNLRDCSYGTAKKFTLVYKDVYQAELKVCSEAKAAAPSASCRYSGTWKIIYKSPL